MCIALPAIAGRGRRGRRDETPDPVVVQPPPPPPLPVIERLFPPNLPLDPGPVPDGIASHSAQACASCHYDVSAQWTDGTHSGPFDDHIAMVEQIGMPACASCHLPLTQQHSGDVVYDQGDATRPVEREHDWLDLTVRSEGVTCASCHVRDGMVVARQDNRSAPHPMATSPDLASVGACASCHQLTLPNAETALYDTVGEWQQSPWATAGIGCVDCHMGGAADGGLDHALPGHAGNGLSVLAHLDAPEVVRGGDPVVLRLVLQNTGGGHALPTGSPFVGWAVNAWIEGPPRGRDSDPDKRSDNTVMLARTLGEAPDYPVLDDTRLAPFEERVLEWPISLDIEAEQGDWYIVVEVRQTTGDQPAPEPRRSWRFPITVR